MITADTSVLVAGFTPGHEFHEHVQPQLARILEKGRLVSHTIAETYSVLSSPSGVFRAEPGAVSLYLSQFTRSRQPIEINAEMYMEAVELLASGKRGGGAIFDAIIAIGAREADSTLITIDHRALPIYETCGTAINLIENHD